jgi:hypothetical protein
VRLCKSRTVYPLLCAPSRKARVQRGKEAEGFRRVRKPTINYVVAVVFFLFSVILFSQKGFNNFQQLNLVTLTNSLLPLMPFVISLLSMAYSILVYELVYQLSFLLQARLLCLNQCQNMRVRYVLRDYHI